MADGMSITEPKFETMHSSVYEEPNIEMATSNDP